MALHHAILILGPFLPHRSANTPFVTHRCSGSPAEFPLLCCFTTEISDHAILSRIVALRSFVLRVTVYDVLQYLASGMTTQQILQDFPYLTADDVQACLAYAADRERTQLVVNA